LLQGGGMPKENRVVVAGNRNSRIGTDSGKHLNIGVLSCCLTNGLIYMPSQTMRAFLTMWITYKITSNLSRGKAKYYLNIQFRCHIKHTESPLQRPKGSFSFKEMSLFIVTVIRVTQIPSARERRGSEVKTRGTCCHGWFKRIYIYIYVILYICSMDFRYTKRADRIQTNDCKH
jgi:hypothetical protein